MASNIENSSSTANGSCDHEETYDKTFQAEGNGELFVRNLALFYLKLQSKYLLPSSVIQYIAEELQSIHSIGFSLCLLKLTTSLKQLDIPEPKIKEIVCSIQDADIFVKCNSGLLRSDYCRNT